MSTTIKLKKSGQIGNTPSNTELDFGELALNYADGILYYKNASGNVAQISGAGGGSSSNTFETINANGTLLIADSNTDVLTISPGTGINVTGNALTDSLEISVRFNDNLVNEQTDLVATANSVNAAANIAYAAYNKANAPITIKEVYASNAAVVNTFANINTIQFDADSGMAVVDEGNNAVTIQLNSTFKTWNINGGPGLVAFGLDTVNFLSANGITLSANNLSTPKTFTIDAPELANAYNEANAAYSLAETAESEALAALAEAENAANTVQILKSDSIVASKSNLNFNDTATVNVSAVSSNGKVNLEFSVNTTGSGIVTAQQTAENAYNQANLAYTAANNSNLLSGGLITGTLNVTQDIIIGGNIYLEGNTTYINVSTYSIEDSLVYYASNNKLTDSVDIGFMGGKNTSGTYSHTGFVRDATDGKWKLFDNLAEEGHVGNVVDFANTTIATFIADVEANTLSVTNGVNGNVNFDSGTLFVDSVNNRVGAGTSTPETKFEVNTNLGGYWTGSSFSGGDPTALTVKNSYVGGYDSTVKFNMVGSIGVRAAGYIGFVGTGPWNTESAASADMYVLFRDPGANTVKESFRIKGGSGNFALGLTDAVDKLTVNGAIGLTNTASSALLSTTRSASYVAATANVEVTVDSFSSSTYRSAKYFIQMSDPGGYNGIEINLIHDNSTVFLTQFGEVKTNGSLGTFDADINGGDVRLLFTPTNNNTTVKLHRITITV